MQMIIGSHADNYNSTYFSELGQIELENSFIELNGFMTDLVVELEARKIVTEDVTVRDVNKGDNKKTTNLKDRIKRVIGNLLKYIKNIIAFFVNKVDDLMNNNDEWLDKNTWKIDGISQDFWNQCDITIYPYDFKNQYGGSNVFSENVYAQAIEPITNTEVNKKILAGFDSKEEMYKTVSPKIYKLNPEDFTAAAKQYYRGGKALIAATGSEAKNLCAHGAKYCNNYKALSNKIKSDLNKYRGDVERFERESDKAATQGGAIEGFLFRNDYEFYSVIEDRMIRYDDLEAVQEADATSVVPGKKLSQSATRSGTTVDAVKNAGKTNGGVTMDTDRDGSDNSDRSESQPSESNTTSQSFTRLLEYYRTVLTIQTARMTIAEEAYNGYMRTLKTVVRTAENRKEISVKRAQDTEKGLARRAGEAVKRTAKKIVGNKSDTE